MLRKGKDMEAGGQSSPASISLPASPLDGECKVKG
jgi:hypothetical protein